MIYFVQAVDGGPIKIGTTENLEKRLKALETIYGRSLIVLCRMDGGRKEEYEIHNRFSHLRLKRVGSKGIDPEQFRPGPDLMSFIGQPFFVNQGDVKLMQKARPYLALVLQMRGSKAWREWARRFAKHCGVRDLAALVDFAFQQTARQQGFTEEPPARWIEKKKED